METILSLAVYLFVLAPLSFLAARRVLTLVDDDLTRHALAKSKIPPAAPGWKLEVSPGLVAPPP